MSGAGARLLGAVQVRVPLRRPFVTAGGTTRAVEPWLVRVCDATGRMGTGEVTLGPTPGRADGAALRERLARAIGGVWDGHVATEPVGLAIAAGMGAALIDAAADEVDPSPVPVNATIAVETLHDSVAAARRAVADGFGTLKVKAGGERSTVELADRLAAIRSAVGPDVALRIDVNGAWSEADAGERLHALDRLRLEYVEQPIAPGDPSALARLRRGAGLPIAADESVGSVADARGLLDARAVDVFVVKPARVGGPAQALAIAGLASADGVDTVISTLLETGVGLAAALWVSSRLPGGSARAHGLATGDLLANDLVLDPIVVRDGTAVAPGGAGLGVRVDEAAVERLAIARLGAWT